MNQVSGVDIDRLTEWMDGEGLGAGPITNIEALGGGTQNVLLKFERDGRRYVLRHPPLHKRGNSDRPCGERRGCSRRCAARTSPIPT